MPAFYEFFAGGGMARAGLGSQWSCLFANDFDAKKGAAYTANWGAEELVVRDVAALSTRDIPEGADLAWASFPCQDLSLAGAGAGLKGERSGTFWSFWQLLTRLDNEQRAPKIVVLENVCGALWSHDGKDFAAIGEALVRGGYRFGAVVVDAGMHSLGARLVGDVAAGAAKRAGAMTPVPGGVGPVTTAVVVLQAARLARARS